MHHPYFAIHYNDNLDVIQDFLPLARKAQHDVFFAGHEHLLNYAVVP